MKKLIFPLLAGIFFFSCDILQELNLPEVAVTGDGLTREEIAMGLKEALEVGTGNASQRLGREDALYGNPQRRIPFPPEAQVVEERLRQAGMGDLVDEFILEMNRGAEKAMVKARPIFVDAIKQMTIRDATEILRGADNAATEYFRRNTEDQLYEAFRPPIEQTMDEMRVTSIWATVMRTYNRLPFQTKVNPDLPDYVTRQAMDRLFMEIEVEEAKIRNNPAARVTELLRRVFAAQ